MKLPPPVVSSFSKYVFTNKKNLIFFYAFILKLFKNLIGYVLGNVNLSIKSLYSQNL